jgi:enoyl-CoA hydratase/carnithine racemase
VSILKPGDLRGDTLAWVHQLILEADREFERMAARTSNLAGGKRRRMTTPLVNSSKHEGVIVLELSNPPANTYSYEMMRQLDAHVLDARFDESVHVLLIIGAGENFFCAGADIKMLEGANPYFKYNFCLHANETLCRLEQTPKLVIAAINGHCVGGGLEVALACDLRIARANAGKVGLPEVSLGVLPGTGGTQRLARALGRAKAIEVMAEGATFSVDEAKGLGLINSVIDAAAGEFRARALEYARRFVPPAKASRAVGFIKRAVTTGLEVGLEQGLALEREFQQRLFEGQDAKEGISAYNARRPPQFSGK